MMRLTSIDKLTAQIVARAQDLADADGDGVTIGSFSIVENPGADPNWEPSGFTSHDGREYLLRAARQAAAEGWRIETD